MGGEGQGFFWWNKNEASRSFGPCRELIWALVLAILLIALGVMVGMDLGVGTLLRFVGKTDVERRAAASGCGASRVRLYGAGESRDGRYPVRWPGGSKTSLSWCR
jgi:hypothetical protein